MESLRRQLAEHLLKNKLKIATAESCTAGGVSFALTEIPGSSAWLERGFVTYSNDAKIEMLGVNAQTIASYGAVSEQTAREMARGALNHSHADIAVSVTGIAGPDGGSDEKPVGTVWFGFAFRNADVKAVLKQFRGDRATIREQSIRFIFECLLELIIKQ